MTPDPEEDPERWVSRRTDFLSSTDVGLREPVAEAVAWKELGYTAGGIAKNVDVTEPTVKNYLERASERYPGICMVWAYEFDYDPEAPVDDLPDPPLRECPVCLKERVHSVEVTERMFPKMSGWGTTEMLDHADKVCSWCHSVRINGQWVRMHSVRARARELASSGNNSRSEYRESITKGSETVPYSRVVGGDEGDDGGGSREVGGMEW